jgi:MSHA biogenesis protein MshK
MMRRGLVLLSGLACAVAAQGQTLDPTRPAAAMTSPDGTPGTAAAAESGIQTVILRPNGKSGAVINGQYVEVGGTLGDRRVLQISESEVVLIGANGREIMKVMPSIEKMQAKDTTAGKRRLTGTREK